MMTLGKLLESVTCTIPNAGRRLMDQPVAGLTSDSRKVGPGVVFVALEGERTDGHRYVHQAVDRGCRIVVAAKKIQVSNDVTVVRVSDSHRAYGLMAAAFYGNPADEMVLIGLTGTNGKTTTSWMIEEVLRAAGFRPGVIGTVNYRYVDRQGGRVVREARLTTPEPVQLQGLLREMSDSKVTHVVMEASSHALVQQRLAGIFFNVGIFTNLSRDHLDFHGSMDEYFAAKKKLFSEFLAPGGIAVVTLSSCARNKNESCADWGAKLIRDLQKKGYVPFPASGTQQAFLSCGFASFCTVTAGNPEQNMDGLGCTIRAAGQEISLHSRLIGRYNVLNMLTAAGAGLAMGIDPENIRKGLAAVRSVPGRLERVRLRAGERLSDDPAVFVDYAHTPDALTNVLQTLRRITIGRLFCVFGCGGDRDRGKRPMMGAIAGRLADLVLVTSDNPRQENPSAILTEIESGLSHSEMKPLKSASLFNSNVEKGYVLMEDRQKAVYTACSVAGKNDVVLIAGKGHETYQIMGRERRFFDDRLEAKNGLFCWNISRLLQATGGRLVSGRQSGIFSRIVIDSRTIEPGDVFVALAGEHFNGHDFVGEAVRKSAAAVIVDRPIVAGKPDVVVIRVNDTLQALGDLARYRRDRLDGSVRVIGITGSSGKTTVKDMTAAIFAAQYRDSACESVLKTRGNLNNLIGLPLSLLRIRAEHRVAVMEMGMNRPGEIDRLAAIAGPDIGCITNVQAAHLEGLGTIDGVARAKGELFDSMRRDDISVVNCDDFYIRRLARRHGGRQVRFAVTRAGRRYHPEVNVTRIMSLGTAGMRFTLRIGDWRQRISVPAVGRHNVANCAAAAAIAFAAGVIPEDIVRGLIQYRSGDKRLEFDHLPGGVHILNDAYNANPSSMAAALQTVVTFGEGCRRAAGLGDMLELGGGSAEAHRKIGTLAAEMGYDFLAVTGRFAPETAAAAVESGMDPSAVKICEDTGVMAEWFAGLMEQNRMRSGDWLLIKGSRGMRMERLLKLLQLRLADKLNG